MKHPKYKRLIKMHNKFKAHNEDNSAHVGDEVQIEETRPFSKEKRFRVVRIVKKAATATANIDEEQK